jgi:Ca2+-binding EF-hand superfamily protein
MSADFRVKQKLQAVLKQRGNGTLGLLNAFKDFDQDNSGTLSWEEFCAALKKGGLYPSAQDIRILFIGLDKDGNNEISYQEFIDGMKNPLSSRRKQTIARVFRSIDTDGDGVISMTDIGACFNPKNHPDVKAGRKSVPALLQEFFETFSTITSTGLVTLEQFTDYYANILAFEDDIYFDELMQSLWNLSAFKPASTVKSLNSLSSAQPVLETQAQASGLLDSLREQLLSRGAKGLVGLQRRFRLSDGDGDKYITFNEFKKSLRDVGLNVSDLELSKLFNFFDKDKSGSISFDEFIVGLRVSKSRLVL